MSTDVSKPRMILNGDGTNYTLWKDAIYVLLVAHKDEPIAALNAPPEHYDEKKATLIFSIPREKRTEEQKNAISSAKRTQEQKPSSWRI
jgi:hypothetical protein